MRGEPGDGVPRTPLRPNASRLPMNPFVAVELKASEYPQKYHWKTMIEKEPMHAQIMDNADFLLASPEYKNPSPGIMSSTMHEETIMYA
jgi:hypothetical protein